MEGHLSWCSGLGSLMRISGTPDPDQPVNNIKGRKNVEAN